MEENSTISRASAWPETLALVDELRDVVRCEEAWAIAQRHLEVMFRKGAIAEREYAEREYLCGLGHVSR